MHKSPGAGARLPAVSAPVTAHQGRKPARYRRASGTRSDPRGAGGRRRGASYRGSAGPQRRPGRWGTEAQGTHGREGDTGQNAQLGGKMGETPSSRTISTTLQRLAQQAHQSPAMACTTLAHLIDVDRLREADRRTRKDGAPGSDGVTAHAYAAHLAANRANWSERLRRGPYRAPPVRRTDLDQEDGGQRPMGSPAFADNMVQRAVVMRLGAMYEQDFWEGSDGVRQGRRPHQALQAWREPGRAGDSGWSVEADVRACVDRVAHALVRARRRPRVADGTILGRIGTWLTAGVVAGDPRRDPARGSPPGGVVSPRRAHVVRHDVLDAWVEREVNPRMNGRGLLRRCADDVVIGCEREEGRPPEYGGAAEALCPRRADHASAEDPPGGGQKAGQDGGVRPWERHMRVSRRHPVVDDIAAGILGDHAEDGPETSAPGHERGVAMVPPPASRPATRAVPAAVPEAPGALPVRRHPGPRPDAGGALPEGGNGVA